MTTLPLIEKTIASYNIKLDEIFQHSTQEYQVLNYIKNNLDKMIIIPIVDVQKSLKYAINKLIKLKNDKAIY